MLIICGLVPAANVLQLPDHPLHFHSYSQIASQSSARRSSPGPEDEEDIFLSNQFPTHMTVHLMTPQIAANRAGGRGVSRTPHSKLKSFFDELINMVPPPPSLTPGDTSEAPPLPTPRKPRIIYVRDFNTLAASSGSWYPALLQSVRHRRAGPITRSTSPVLNPTTIIFGVTPPVVPKLRPSGGGSGIGGLYSTINVLMNQRSSSGSERERVGGTGKPGNTSGTTGSSKGEWGEDESSDRAREKRLKDRLKRWEKSEKMLLADELPTLQATSSGPEESPPSRSGVSNSEGGFPGLAVGGAFSPLSGAFPGHVLQALMGGGPDSRPGLGPNSPAFPSPSFDGSDGSTSPNNFFRSSVVVPSQRSVLTEKTLRMNRRREINELTIRMAISSIGGTLPPLEVPFLESARRQAESDGVPSEERADLVRMWDAWGRVVAVWSVVKQVADRALGSVFVAQRDSELQHQTRSKRIPKLSLDPTVVPWSAIAQSFLTKASAGAMRRHWAKEIAKGGEIETAKEQNEEGNIDGKSGRKGREDEVDEVIERVKQDPDLDQHEQKLLGCIVDPSECSHFIRHFRD